jgi:hypothetical protein
MAKENNIETVVIEAAVKGCYLRSKAEHPIDVKIGDNTMVVSPRAKVFVKDESKLGQLPVGIIKV